MSRIFLLLLIPLLLCQCRSKEQVTYSTGFDGIDVSHHNGAIDWKMVKKNKNIQFVYIKATEGKTHVDRNYLANARGAHDQKLKVGIYHYFTSRSSATEQFNWFNPSFTPLKNFQLFIIPICYLRYCKSQQYPS